MEHDEVRPGPEHDPHATPAGEPQPSPAVAEPDLERIAGDLADVEQALDRLDDGSYWTDEITSEPIPDERLAEDPTARRVAYVPGLPPTSEADSDAAGSTDAGDPPPEA